VVIAEMIDVSIATWHVSMYSRAVETLVSIELATETVWTIDFLRKPKATIVMKLG
jgi:hypothetical protein